MYQPILPTMENILSVFDETTDFMKISAVSNTHLKTFNEFRKSGELCDVTIVQEGRKIQAHKLVLSAASPYFKTLFTIDMKEANMEEISIPEMPYRTMEELIEYMYTGEIIINTNNGQSIILAAHYLQMTEIIQHCGRYNITKIDKDNCLTMRQLLISVGCDKNITDMATDYVTAHFIPISKSDEFLQLNIDDIVELLSFNQLYTDNEQDVYDSGMRWLNAKPGRKVYAERILRCIRLHLLDPSFIESRVSSEEVLRNNGSCNRLINDYHLNEQPPRVCTNALVSLLAFRRVFNEMTPLEIYDELSNGWSVFDKIRFYEYVHKATIFNSHMLDISCKNTLYNIINQCRKKGMTGVALPFSIFEHQASTITAVNNKFYAIGGTGIFGTPTNDVKIYDMNENRWIIRRNMLQKRANCRAVVLGKYIYVCGGDETNPCPNSNALNSVERMDIDTEIWEYVAPMNEGRSSFGICAHNGKIYVAGGKRNQTMYSFTLEVYNPEENGWITLAESHYQRANVSLVPTLGKIYAIAGFGENGGMDSVEYYDIIKNKWTIESSICEMKGDVACCLLATSPDSL